MKLDLKLKMNIYVFRKITDTSSTKNKQMF